MKILGTLSLIFSSSNSVHSIVQRGRILLRVNMPPNSPRYLGALTKEKLKEIWRTADAVCFDVDSTVVQEEGIDELAEFCGVGEAVRQW